MDQLTILACVVSLACCWVVMVRAKRACVLGVDPAAPGGDCTVSRMVDILAIKDDVGTTCAPSGYIFDAKSFEALKASMVKLPEPEWKDEPEKFRSLVFNPLYSVPVFQSPFLTSIKKF